MLFFLNIHMHMYMFLKHLKFIHLDLVNGIGLIYGMKNNYYVSGFNNI